MAAAVMKVGKSKVRINKPDEAVQAMTKDDVRALIAKHAIEKREFRSPSRARARKTTAQKKKGRQKGRGSKRGAYGARIKGKEAWMEKVRSLRNELNSLQPKIIDESYRRLYKMIKGGYFRNKSHLKLYITEKKLWKQEKKTTTK